MAARFSTHTRDEIVFHGWLVIDESGAMKLTRAEPLLQAGERACKLDLKTPRSIFRTPQLAVKINVADAGASVDLAEAVVSAQSAIKGRGIEVRVVD